jgi:hypothetical protein
MVSDLNVTSRPDDLIHLQKLAARGLGSTGRRAGLPPPAASPAAGAQGSANKRPRPPCSEFHSALQVLHVQTKLTRVSVLVTLGLSLAVPPT